MGILKGWVDGSFAVHPNMRGHTGGGLTMGHGFPLSSSTKQKLNTRSSTESEVVGVDDLMPAILWMRNFLQAKGYGVKECIVFQEQQECHPVGEEWQGFQFQANEAHQHSLILRDQQDQEGQIVHGMVSNRRHAWGFLDQAHSGQAIHTRP